MDELTLALILLGKPLLAILVGYVAYTLHKGLYRSRLTSFIVLGISTWCLATLLLRVKLFNDEFLYMFINVWDSIVIRIAFLIGILFIVSGLFTKSINNLVYGFSICGTMSFWLVLSDITMSLLGYLNYPLDANISALVFLQIIIVAIAIYTVYHTYDGGFKSRLFLSFFSGAFIWTLVAAMIWFVFRETENYFDNIVKWHAVTAFLVFAVSISITLFGLVKWSGKTMQTGGIIFLASVSGMFSFFIFTGVLALFLRTFAALVSG